MAARAYQSSEHTAWLKRTAAQLYTQLPQDPDDALVVLGLVKRLLDEDLDREEAKHIAFGIFQEVRQKT